MPDSIEPVTQMGTGRGVPSTILPSDFLPPLHSQDPVPRPSLCARLPLLSTGVSSQESTKSHATSFLQASPTSLPSVPGYV